MYLLNLSIYKCFFFIYLRVRSLRGTELFQIAKGGNYQAARRLGGALYFFAVLFKHVEELYHFTHFFCIEVICQVSLV